MSVDALRGFDMFWIIGADALVYALKRIADGLRGTASEESAPFLYKFVKFLAEQLDHAEWQGFRFYDLIFPLFVFIVGVSIVFSLTKLLHTNSRAEALQRVFRRFLLMYAVAVLYSGGFSNPVAEIRWLGVLNRIALCYFFASLIFIFFKPRAMIAIAAGLLIGYWALMSFVPIRDIKLQKPVLDALAKETGATNSMAFAREVFSRTTATTTGKFEPGYNLANHLDFQFLPGKKWDTYWDPEGYLSTIPAIATCLLGVFAGLLLQSPKFSDQQKLIYLVAAGLVALNLGWAWGMQFPVIKKIWTSSYVLMAGGYSALLLALFYFIVDVKKKQAWCQPFVWMGMNSITIYLTSNVIGGFRKLAQRFVGGDVKVFFDSHLLKGSGDLIIAIVGLLLAFWYVRFLYKKKIFLRL